MKKILVVESSHPIEGLSGSLFRRRECTLEVASSCAEGLALAEESRPDLVICDSLVTDFPPADFIQALHSSEGSTVLPVIVVIQAPSAAEEGALLRAGAAAALGRPLDVVEFNIKVCALLGISLRRHVRTFVKMKVDATVGSVTHFATISDISLGGVLIETDRSIRTGEILKLAFFLPGDDDAITVFAKTMRETAGRAGGSKAYGCQFLDLSERARLRVHEFVTATEGDDDSGPA